MPTITVLFKSNLSIKILCDKFELDKETNEYKFFIKKENVKSIKESPDLPKIEGVLID